MGLCGHDKHARIADTLSTTAGMFGRSTYERVTDPFNAPATTSWAGQGAQILSEDHISRTTANFESLKVLLESPNQPAYAQLRGFCIRRFLTSGTIAALNYTEFRMGETVTFIFFVVRS